MGRSIIVLFVVGAMVAGCAGAGEVVSTTTSPTPATTSSTVTSTIPETSPTTTTFPTTSTPAPPPATSAPVPVPPPNPPVILEQADLAGRQLVWEMADVELDRGPVERTLVVAGDSLWIVRWSRSHGFEVWSSSDGAVWDPPVEPAGVPAAMEPAMLQFAPWVTGGPAGAVVLGDTAEFGAPRHVVVTTADGTEWTAHPSLTDGSEVRSVAVGEHGFLVVGDARTAWLSTDGVAWSDIALPVGPQWDVAAVAAGDHFVIAGEEAVLIVDTNGQILAMPAPGPLPLFTHVNAWGDGFVTVARGELRAGPWRIALLETTDLATWSELPVPVLAGPQDWRSGEIWGVEAVAAGASGITVAAYYPDGMFDFWGNGFQGIEFPFGNDTGVVFGDSVMVQVPGGGGVESSFDEQGTLTITNRATAEIMATLPCAQLRALARRQAPRGRSLVEWPEQAILWSPDGRAWEQRDAAELFGRGSYVVDLADFGGRVIAMVVPSGEAPIPDPPNCPLGLYPDRGPIEIWIGTPGL